MPVATEYLHLTIKEGLAPMSNPMSAQQLQQFNDDGYFIARQLASDSVIAHMNQVTDDSVSPALAPVEYEADVHYPGAQSYFQQTGY